MPLETWLYPHTVQRGLLPAFIQCCLFDLSSTGIGSQIFHIWKILIWLGTSIAVTRDVFEIQLLMSRERTEPINLIYGVSFLTQSDDNWSIPAWADLMDFPPCGKKALYLSPDQCFKNESFKRMNHFSADSDLVFYEANALLHKTYFWILFMIVPASYIKEDQLNEKRHSVCHVSLVCKVG